MTHLFPNYKRESIDLVKGFGNYVVDQTGKEYLDFTSGIGVNSLGHQHPKLIQALEKQMHLIWHTSNLYSSKLQEDVAKKLANDKNYLGFFCNSGTEANEAAIKLARKATGRSKIISFQQSFHGRTYGALSATGQEALHEGFAPILPDFQYVPYNEIEPLQQIVDQNTAAVMIELIQGEGGVLPADVSFVQQVAKLCKEQGALLVVDEIQTGIGRTGNFYAFEGYGIEPDIFTLAKALGNGIPVGAMLGKKELKDAFGPGSHGTTFGGNKLALRVALSVIDIINDENFLAEVKKKGEYAMKALGSLKESSDKVLNVRGQGLMIGIQLTDADTLNAAVSELQKKGLLVLKAGNNTMRLLPPLTIEQGELEKGVGMIRGVLSE